MSQPYETLRLTRSDDGALVTVEMHRPEALNAMNTAMGRELLGCFDGFFWDKQTRVVILTGAGEKAFCVGGDLKEPGLSTCAEKLPRPISMRSHNKTAPKYQIREWRSCVDVLAARPAITMLKGLPQRASGHER